ncbi:UNVERIFIED_CONTAM: hypothetical protein FKN15_045393 [Acipenser sinensis]
MERQRQELGVAPLIIQEREPTELKLLLQRWELPSREPEGMERPSREPEGVELPSREPEGVEPPLPEQPTMQVGGSWSRHRGHLAGMLPGRSTARHSRLPGLLLHSPWNPRHRCARGRLDTQGAEGTSVPPADCSAPLAFLTQGVIVR